MKVCYTAAMVLYVEGFGDRINARKLSETSAGSLGWIVGGSSFENLAKESVLHESLESAKASPDISISEESLIFARNLAKVLGHACLPASEADTIGRIVVFSDDESKQGLPSAKTCVDALGLKHKVGDINLIMESTVTPKNWALYSGRGFCYYLIDYEDEEDDENIEEDADRKKILAATELMASDLTDHFEYNMSEEIVCGPVLYGGRHNHSNAIIAVLSMRVWT